mgnify:CR=1 FL=1
MRGGGALGPQPVAIVGDGGAHIGDQAMAANAGFEAQAARMGHGARSRRRRPHIHQHRGAARAQALKSAVPRLEREAGRHIGAGKRHVDDPARFLAPAIEKREAAIAVAQMAQHLRHPLGGVIQLGRRIGQHQRKRVGDEHHDDAGGLGLLDRRAVIAIDAERVRPRHDEGRDRVVDRALVDCDAERLTARRRDVADLRMDAAGQYDARALLAVMPPGDADRLGRGRRLVEQRGVGEFEAGEIVWGEMAFNSEAKYYEEAYTLTIFGEPGEVSIVLSVAELERVLQIAKWRITPARPEPER